jgi:hypothetical protein
MEAINDHDAHQYSHATGKMNFVLKGLWDGGVETILDELGFAKAPSGGQ